MGRGRQKAKQTKVARELKYYTPPTDLNALQRELGSVESDKSPRYVDPEPSHDGDEDDPYDDYVRRWG